MKDHTEDPDDKTEPIEYTQWSKPHRDILDRGLWDDPNEILPIKQPRSGTLVGIGPEARGLGTRKAPVQGKPGVQARPAESARAKRDETKAVPKASTPSTMVVRSIAKNRQVLAAFGVSAGLVIAFLVFMAAAKPKMDSHVEPLESVAVSVTQGAPSAMSPPDAVTNVPPAASATVTGEDAARVHPPVTAKQAAPVKPPVQKKPVVAPAPLVVTAEKKEMAPEKVEPQVAPAPAATPSNQNDDCRLNP